MAIPSRQWLDYPRQREISPSTGSSQLDECGLFFGFQGVQLAVNGGALVLLPLSKTRFRVVNMPGSPNFEMAFVRPIAGGPLQVKETGSPAAGLGTKIYDAVNREIPTSDQLAEFTGKYLSDELPGATYVLSIKDGKLLLLIRNGLTVFSDRAFVLAFSQTGNEVQKDVLLTPLFADAFTFLGSTFVRFTRNPQNVVLGFEMTGSSVRKLRFNKQ